MLFAQATGTLGTKADPVMGAGGGGATVGGSQLLQMIVAVAIVVALLTLAPKLIAKLGRGRAAPARGQIAVQDSVTLPGGAIHLVAFEGRRLLVGITSHSIATLADLGNPAPDEPVFFEVLDEAIAAPADVDEALRRLERLGG